MKRYPLVLAGLACFFIVTFSYDQLNARDTIRVSFEDFVAMATEFSANLDAQKQQVHLAENRVKQVRANRFLPNLNLTTAHGLVPGVKSQMDLSPGRYYLDPNLENDWENWGIFTQAEISGIQPVYTWGGITNLIQAARKGADAAQYEFDSDKESFVLQLFELYQSALFVQELERLLENADEQLDRAEREIERMRDEGDVSLEEKDVFEFNIFKAEFQSHRNEVQQTSDFIRRSWDLILSGNGRTVYLPEARFLDPVPVQIQEINFYKQSALSNRAELKGIGAAQEAAQYGVEAARSQYYPSLVLGASGGFGYTPNRPRQTNPFIRNNTNFISARVGFGFQQNLNFRQVRTQVQRSEIQLRQTRDYRDAAQDGILLQLHDTYREANITKSRRESKREALRIANEWLRTEQIDFDIGFGDIKNLVDAVKKKMELELDVTQLTFDLNLKMAQLHRSAGLPLEELFPQTSDE